MMFAVLIVCLMPLFCEPNPLEQNLIYNLTDSNGNPYGVVRIKRKSVQPPSEKIYQSRRYRQKDNLIDSVLTRGDDSEEQDVIPSSKTYETLQNRNFRKTKQNIVPQKTQSGSSKERFMGQENENVKEKSLPDLKKARSFTETKPKKINKETKEINSMLDRSQIKQNHDLSLTPEKSNTKKKISPKQEHKPHATEIKSPLQEKNWRLSDKGESKKGTIRYRSQDTKVPASPRQPNKKIEVKTRHLKENIGEQKQLKKSASKGQSDTRQRKPLNGNPKIKSM